MHYDYDPHSPAPVRLDEIAAYVAAEYTLPQPAALRLVRDAARELELAGPVLYSQEIPDVLNAIYADYETDPRDHDRRPSGPVLTD